MEMLYAGQIVKVKPYGLTLIARDVPHGIRVVSEQLYERYTVHFTEEVLTEPSLAYLLSVFDTERFPQRNNHLPGMVHMSLLEEFKNLIHMCTLPKGQRDLLAPSMIQSLLTNVGNACLEHVRLCGGCPQ